MRGLTILLAAADAERLRTALSLAAAQAALGGAAHVFCQNEAVALLRPPVAGERDAAHAAAGLPTLAALLGEALALGVTITACQSGLALTGTDARALDARIAFGGPIGVLQALGADRLVCL
ncbi:MAG: peroxiredoxin [Sphingomonas sp.]